MPTTAALTIKWLGQACFVITTMSGANIVIDPFAATLGYEPPAVQANVAFVSHDHRDHNATNLLKGDPKVIGPLKDQSSDQGAIKIGKETIAYKSILTDHDNLGGNERGANTARVITVNGVRICHVGDLGHLLTPVQVKAIGPVDVLMIPVGGFYTIDGKQAQKVVGQLKPKIVIPMHYKTPASNNPNLATADEFLKGFKCIQKADKLTISPKTFPKETTVFVLKY